MSTVKKYSTVEWLIGRYFWEFVSDEPNCINEIYEISGVVGETFEGPHGQTLSEVIEAKVVQLKTKFEQIYGLGGINMWKNLLGAWVTTRPSKLAASLLQSTFIFGVSHFSDS